MKIRSLDELNKLPLAASDEEVDTRVCAVLEFYRSNSTLPIELVAESIVDALCNISYSERISESTEEKVLVWVDNTFDQFNERYLDALATIYANMKSQSSLHDLNARIKSLSTTKAKNILGEALDEFGTKN